MQSVTSATVVATTARANDITLFASLELSQAKWVVTINSPGSEKFSKHVVEGGDGAGLLDLLSRSRAKAEQRYGVQIEHEGLWSEPTSSTGCEVMRSSGLPGKDGLTLRIQTPKEHAQCRNE